MVDSTGNVVAKYKYDLWGVQTKESGTKDAEFGYGGYYVHRPSGLYLTWYRQYDPSIARWLSRDPIGEQGGLNLYAYVLNDPLAYTDQLGLYVALDTSDGLPRVHGRLDQACPPNNCAEIKEDIRKLQLSIANRRIDRTKAIERAKLKGNRNPHHSPSVQSHKKRIDLEEAALAKCWRAYKESGCDDDCNEPTPVKIPVPAPDPKTVGAIAIGVSILICIVCPSCCVRVPGSSPTAIGIGITDDDGGI
jgi:RHS repeat-associated protein